MKQIFLYILLVFSVVASAQDKLGVSGAYYEVDSISIGGTKVTKDSLDKMKSDIFGKQSRLVFNVKDYGATGDGVADNTTAIQNAINAAHTVKGRVFFPEGTYLVTTLQWYPDVYLQGVSVQGTTLKSTAASPLLYYTSSASVWQSTAGIADMAIRGNSIGTFGVDLLGVFHVTYDRVVFEGFSNSAVRLKAGITHVFNKCTFANSPYGVYMASNTITSEGMVKANYCIFNQCGFFGNTTWGAYVTDGAGIYFNQCDFESNGTVGNMSTGVIYGDNMCSDNTNAEELGIILNGGWLERNRGQAILLGATTGRARHVLRDLLIKYPENSSQNGVYVKNGATRQHLLIEGSTIDGHASDVKTDGVNAATIVIESTIGNHTELNSGVYTLGTFGGGGSGTVNSGTANQLAYYAANGTAVSGNNETTYDGSTFLVNNPTGHTFIKASGGNGWAAIMQTLSYGGVDMRMQSNAADALFGTFSNHPFTLYVNNTIAATFKTSKILNLAYTPTYADNAAATTGGLVAGDVYRTSTGQLMIVY